MDNISRIQIAITLYDPQSHYTKKILIDTAHHYGNWAPEGLENCGAFTSKRWGVFVVSNVI